MPVTDNQESKPTEVAANKTSPAKAIQELLTYPIQEFYDTEATFRVSIHLFIANLSDPKLVAKLKPTEKYLLAKFLEPYKALLKVEPLKPADGSLEYVVDASGKKFLTKRSTDACIKHIAEAFSPDNTGIQVYYEQFEKITKNQAAFDELILKIAGHISQVKEEMPNVYPSKNDALVGSLGINAYNIMGVQRPMRYPLLLKEINKGIIDNNPDDKRLAAAAVFIEAKNKELDQVTKNNAVFYSTLDSLIARLANSSTVSKPYADKFLNFLQDLNDPQSTIKVKLRALKAIRGLIKEIDSNKELSKMLARGDENFKYEMRVLKKARREMRDEIKNQQLKEFENTLVAMDAKCKRSIQKHAKPPGLFSKIPSGPSVRDFQDARSLISQCLIAIKNPPSMQYNHCSDGNKRPIQDDNKRRVLMLMELSSKLENSPVKGQFPDLKAIIDRSVKNILATEPKPDQIEFFGAEIAARTQAYKAKSFNSTLVDQFQVLRTQYDKMLESAMGNRDPKKSQPLAPEIQLKMLQDALAAGKEKPVVVSEPASLTELRTLRANITKIMTEFTTEPDKRSPMAKLALLQNSIHEMNAALQKKGVVPSGMAKEVSKELQAVSKFVSQQFAKLRKEEIVAPTEVRTPTPGRR